MKNTCTICGEQFNDEYLLIIHNEVFHQTENLATIDDGVLNELLKSSVLHPAESQGTSRQSVIQYAPSNKLIVELQAQALPRSVVRHFIIKNTKFEIHDFLKESKDLIMNTLINELKRLHFIKFGILLSTIFSNVQNETSARGFLTKNRTIMKTSDLNTIIEECLNEITQKIFEHEGRGSGWSLLSVQHIDIRVHKHGYGDRGSSYIPLPNKISATKSCINVRNEDNQCFRYAMLAKFINSSHVERPDNRYKTLNKKYNFQGISYPVSLNDVKKFEKQNPTASVNVFGLDDSNNVFPLQITRAERNDHTDLLFIKSGEVSHFVYIKDFDSLVWKQLCKRRVRIITCKRCFCYSSNSNQNERKKWLTEHLRLCNERDVVQISLPTSNRSTVKFNKTSQQYRIPITVYADFESTLLPLDTNEAEITSRSKYQLHKPNSFCMMIKSTLTEEHLQRYGLSSTPLVYRGTNVSSKFLDELYLIAGKVEELYNYIVPIKHLVEEEQRHHDIATQCYLCNLLFTADNHKVRDHDHLTGIYRGAACNNCNINYKLPRFIPVVLHNLSGYDAHFIIPELGRDSSSIDVLATSMEKFISFSKKVGKIKLRFVDSFRFMPSSLLRLTTNLRRDDLIETKKIVPADLIELILRKGVYPYDYINDIKRFEETTLPPKECFYNKLNEEHISTKDYQHACTVWDKLNMKTIGEYSDFYVKLDVTLLCDVMEEFRNTCMTAYELDPLHFYTSPGLAWQAMLKQTKCKLELLTDIDMLLMVEAGVRGGLTQSVTRHVAANNKYLPNYDSTKESIYLGYFDANNLYGWAMNNPLPYGDFKWINPEDLGDICNIPRHGSVGYIMEVDFEYPEMLHDYHHDLPMLAKTETPPTGKFPKLMMTLKNKDRYVAHYWVVQQAIAFGLRITKVHRVIQFSQSSWLKPYIDSNTQRRAAAVSTFQKDFFKLMNNAIFGKTLENKRKHKNVKLVSDPSKLEKLVRKPNFQTSIIINEHLVAVSMNKTKIKMDRPLYVGMSILDISKTHMYEFHYNKMVAYYGRDNIGISYMDTDAFIYWIKTMDMYEDLRTFPYKDDFDFSDYPSNHPTYDNGRHKKVLGKFKDETNGEPLQEIVALMSKLYSLRILRVNTAGEEDVIKKAKGIKNLYLKKKLNFNNYKRCLFENITSIARFNTIRSFNHQLYSVTEVKKALSCNDDKRRILPDGIHTLPYGHYSEFEITDI